MKRNFALLLILALCMLAGAALADTTTYTGACDPIVITGTGDETIILDGVTITATSGPALSIEDTVQSVTIILKGESALTGSSHYAAIENNGVPLTIQCEKTGAGHTCDDGCGSLTATGGYSGAGIGGSQFSDGSNITISGGNVTAQSKDFGAGIGGGMDGAGTDIAITGGNVTATGGFDAAGIGGGMEGAGTNIEISGGNVTAQGGDYAAGIGGGFNAAGTDIAITGGNVTAQGGSDGAGIGGGCFGDASNITVSVTTVNAIPGGSGAEGIGGGRGGSSSNITLPTPSNPNPDPEEFNPPKTGDDFNPVLWMAIAVLSMVGIVIFSGKRKAA